MVINSTRQPSDFILRIISTISGWARGSPRPPNKTPGGRENGRKSSTIRSNVELLIIPVGSFQLCRMQIRHSRLQ